jgi:LETM1 and EF-hand domain-containing protein 1, mitochondrial
MSFRLLSNVARRTLSAPNGSVTRGGAGAAARARPSADTARNVFVRTIAGESQPPPVSSVILRSLKSNSVLLLRPLSVRSSLTRHAFFEGSASIESRYACTMPRKQEQERRAKARRPSDSREFRTVVRPRISAGVSKQRSTRARGLSSTSSSSPDGRLSFRDALKSPRKAAAYASQSRHDLADWARHMWAGVKLLAADVRISWKVLSKISHGKAITRRERNFIVQTGVDLARLVPFSLFLIIPAAEFALPFALRLFPNMLPSQFQSQMQKEENMTRKLKANIELAKYLRDVVENQAKSIKSSNKDSAIKQEASQLTEFLEAIRSGKNVDVSEVSRFARLFTDELTLDGAVRPQLVAMCKFLGISAHGTDQLLRFRLRSRLNSIKSDDMSIAWEGGANSLTDEEVEKACRDRGISTVAVSKSRLRSQLSDWLEMSQDKAVPGSLMVLSRAFLYTGEEGLKEALSSLPDAVVEDVTMAAAGGDGSTIDRLEEARRQSQLIEMESEREARKEKDAEEKKKRAEAEAEAAAEAAAAAEAEAAIEKQKDLVSGDTSDTIASESISDAKATAAAVAHESKIITDNFEPVKDTTGADVCPAAHVELEAGGGDTAASQPAYEGIDVVHRDEDTIAKERDAIKRVVDAFQALSSESAVEVERKELGELKAELAEAESVLASMGDGKQSELRRFKIMVQKLEQQVEAVDAKVGASMKLLDLDNDGVMSMRECVNAVQMLADSEADAEIVTEALRRLDADADGNISREDIKRLLIELQEEAGGRDVREISTISLSTAANGASAKTSAASSGSGDT